MKIRLLIASIALALSFAGCDKQQSQKSVESAEELADSRPLKQQGELQVDAPTEEEPEEDAPRIERALLWKIEGPNGPLYLFGTIHGGIRDLTWDDFPAETRQALDAAQIVALEADLNNVDRQELAKSMMLPSDESLREKLGEETFAELVEATGGVSMVVDRLQPWAAYSEFSRKMLGDGKAVDKLIEDQARAFEKELVYLESVDEQIRVLQEAVDVELLRYMIETRGDQQELLDKLVTSYRTGDAEGLAEVAFDPQEMERHPKMYELLFDRRNKAWVGELEKLIERGNVFVAVGAGHLVGNSGYRDPAGLANVNAQEIIYGGRLTLHDWASLVVAAIEAQPLTNNPMRLLPKPRISTRATSKWRQAARMSGAWRSAPPCAPTSPSG